MIRLGREPKDFKEKRQISAIQLAEEFALSPTDRKSTPPHLSVWVDVLTTPQQAYSFLPENSPRKLVLKLKPEEVQAIVGRSTDKTAHPKLLNVMWVHITEDFNGKQIRDRRPGADGHSGIVGLDEDSISKKLGEKFKSDKILRKDLRAQLAELASKDCRLLFEE